MNENIINAIWQDHASQAKPAIKSQAKEISKDFSTFMKEEADEKPREMILVQKNNHATALRQANDIIDENGTNAFLLLQEEDSGEVVETRAHMGDVANALYRHWG